MNESFRQKIIIAVISAIVGSVITGCFSFYNREKTEDQMRDDTTRAIVYALAQEFTVISKQMSFDEAIGHLKTETETLKNDLIEARKTIATLEKEAKVLKQRSFVESYQSMNVLRENVTVKTSLDKAVAIIDNRVYFSIDAVKYALENHFAYYQVDGNNVFSYAVSEVPASSEKHIALLDTNVLYDGDFLKIIPTQKIKSMSIGANTYYEGFELDINGGGISEVFFQPNGMYSKLTFDVGRINGHEKKNAVITVWLDGQQLHPYVIDYDKAITSVEIDLRYAKEMKWVVETGGWASYGFVNLYLDK